MKKEQKEQVKTILKDINGAVKSWLEPIKEEQDKLIELIKQNNKDYNKYNDMYYGRTPKEENYHNKWSDNIKQTNHLRLINKYYTRLYKHITHYISYSIYILSCCLCNNKKDFQDLLNMIKFEKAKEEKYCFYTYFDKHNLRFESALFNTYESETSCLYVSDFLYIFNNCIYTQILERDYINNNYNFNKLNDKDLETLTNNLYAKRNELIKKLNDSFKYIDIDYMLSYVPMVEAFKKQQEEEHNAFMNKQREEYQKIDILDISRYINDK